MAIREDQRNQGPAGQVPANPLDQSMHPTVGQTQSNNTTLKDIQLPRRSFVTKLAAGLLLAGGGAALILSKEEAPIVLVPRIARGQDYSQNPGLFSRDIKELSSALNQAEKLISQGALTDFKSKSAAISRQFSVLRAASQDFFANLAGSYVEIATRQKPGSAQRLLMTGKLENYQFSDPQAPGVQKSLLLLENLDQRLEGCRIIANNMDGFKLISNPPFLNVPSYQREFTENISVFKKTLDTVKELYHGQANI